MRLPLIAPPEQLLQQPLRQFGDKNTKIAYRIIGSGPALLMIHGFPLHGDTYRKLIPDLSRDYTCVVVDLPGAGESSWNRSTDFTFPAQAHRLRDLMSEIGPERSPSSVTTPSDRSPATSPCSRPAGSRGSC